jgi:hypothetical protein
MLVPWPADDDDEDAEPCTLAPTGVAEMERDDVLGDLRAVLSESVCVYVCVCVCMLHYGDEAR